MINFKDYELPDGRINWVAYRHAKRQAGEICSNCSGTILWPKGRLSVCDDCLALEQEKGEVSHENRIRCPGCRRAFDPCEFEDLYLFQEGEHEVLCPSCDCSFEVKTIVRYSFQSPELSDGA